MECMPDLATGNPARISDRLFLMSRHLDVTMTYQAVLQDLLIWIQNASLSEITGARVPLRQPRDPALARVIEQPNGQLEIVEGGTPWPIAPDPFDEATAPPPSTPTS